MRILIVGAGGVGGYLTAYLAKSSHDLSLVARADHAKTIKEDGITIIENEGSWNIKVSHVLLLDELVGKYDLVLLCIKSYDIAEIISKIKLYVNPQTIVIPFANGVEHADTIQTAIDAKVLDGCIYILSHIKEAGVIEKKGKVFAAVFGSNIHVKETGVVKELFESVELRVKTAVNIKKEIWKKYIFISTFASLTSYYDMSIKDVYDKHFKEAETLLKEIAMVAYAKGIDIDAEVKKLLQTASSLPQDASTSMHLDVSKKRPCELETLSGYIVKEGKKLHVNTPVMSKIYNKYESTIMNRGENLNQKPN